MEKNENEIDFNDAETLGRLAQKLKDKSGINYGISDKDQINKAMMFLMGNIKTILIICFIFSILGIKELIDIIIYIIKML
jgi:positive regulator of sigma E activity